MSLRKVAIGSGRCMIFCMMSCIMSPANGVLPPNIRYAIVPNAYRSARLSTPISGCICSGDINSGVPMIPRDEGVAFELVSVTV